jgi:hypothetical protein
MDSADDLMAIDEMGFGGLWLLLGQFYVSATKPDT